MRFRALYTAFMRISRSLAFVMALAAGLLVSGYLYTHLFLTKKFALNHAYQGGTCVGATHPSSEKKENPNRMLFISCGGFL